MILFREKYPSAKAPIGSNDIIFVYSRQGGIRIDDYDIFD